MIVVSHGHTMLLIVTLKNGRLQTEQKGGHIELTENNF